jgi:hypothetical protein
MDERAQERGRSGTGMSRRALLEAVAASAAASATGAWTVRAAHPGIPTRAPMGGERS